MHRPSSCRRTPIGCVASKGFYEGRIGKEIVLWCLAVPSTELIHWLKSQLKGSVGLGAMAHKSNPYKKARSKFRWKWKKKRTRRLQKKRRKMRQRSK